MLIAAQDCVAIRVRCPDKICTMNYYTGGLLFINLEPWKLDACQLLLFRSEAYHLYCRRADKYGLFMVTDNVWSHSLNLGENYSEDAVKAQPSTRAQAESLSRYLPRA